MMENDREGSRGGHDIEVYVSFKLWNGRHSPTLKLLDLGIGHSNPENDTRKTPVMPWMDAKRFPLVRFLELCSIFLGYAPQSCPCCPAEEKPRQWTARSSAHTCSLKFHPNLTFTDHASDEKIVPADDGKMLATMSHQYIDIQVEVSSLESLHRLKQMLQLRRTDKRGHRPTLGSSPLDSPAKRQRMDGSSTSTSTSTSDSATSGNWKRGAAFRTALLKEESRCAVTGDPTMLQAAHILPVAHGETFFGLAMHFISIRNQLTDGAWTGRLEVEELLRLTEESTAPASRARPNSIALLDSRYLSADLDLIDSTKNGLLLVVQVHQLFDAHHFMVLQGRIVVLQEPVCRWLENVRWRCISAASGSEELNTDEALAHRDWLQDGRIAHNMPRLASRIAVRSAIKWSRLHLVSVWHFFVAYGDTSLLRELEGWVDNTFESLGRNDLTGGQQQAGRGMGQSNQGSTAGGPDSGDAAAGGATAPDDSAQQQQEQAHTNNNSIASDSSDGSDHRRFSTHLNNSSNSLATTNTTTLSSPDRHPKAETSASAAKRTITTRPNEELLSDYDDDDEGYDSEVEVQAYEERQLREREQETLVLWQAFACMASASA